MGKDKNNRKRKASAAVASDATPAGRFSLFSAPKDSDLGNIFSASAALALPKEKEVKRARVEKVEDKVTEEGSEEEEVVEEEEEEVEDDDEGSDEGSEASAAEEEEETQKGAAKAEKEEDPASEAESDISLTHESLKPTKKKGKKVVYVPPGETKEERDRRTVFIGNVGIDVAKNKSAQNQLRAHLLQFAPSARIESLRCRSVAFATPTAALPDEDEKAANKRANREKNRAAQWRAAQEGSTTGGAGTRRGDDDVVDKSKSFLDTKGKRKVAFIKGDFHSDASSCNAYVVFGYAPPDRSANVAPILDPFEAAEKVLSADGSVFQGRTIRVDRLRLPSSIALEKATNALGKRDAWLPSGTDPKQSLFVGGLDYAAKDEDVRAFFEALVVAERGQPENGHWVTGVRIVRDRDTQLGKGFGYVHFVDRESVDEMIALPSAKLKFAKKPLRVQPARTLPAHVKVHAKAEEKKDAKAKVKKPAAGPIPRGNPALGEKIKDLSKEERKAVKSADADRLARRAAKKRNKVAAAHRETGAVKLAATKAEKKRTEKKVKAKKGRVRSAHALSKAKGSRA